MGRDVRDRLRSVRLAAFVCAIAGLSLCALGWILQPAQFYRSYLMAWLFWIGFGLGALALLMLQQLVKGNWRIATQPFLEAAMLTVPAMIFLYLPLLTGVQSLYLWARPGAMDDPHLRSKAAYLNIPFFLGRTFFYLAAWIILIALVVVFLKRDRVHQSESSHRSLRRVGAFGLVLLALTVTFGSIDWGMSLEPQWHSSIYGAIFMVSQVLSALCLTVLGVSLFARTQLTAETPPADIFNDLGNLILTFLMLWAYTTFSQYLLIWAGNLPVEVVYYARRTQGGWQALPLLFIPLHFLIPFALLLSREFKRNPKYLSRLAVVILLMRLVDHYWTIMPAFTERPHPHWLDVAALAGLGGIWFGGFFWLLPRRQTFIELTHPVRNEHAQSEAA